METSAAITRRSGSNLALAFILLPKHRRQGMAALYAFCREVDDVADEDTRPVNERADLLQAWRTDVHAACSGGSPQFPVNRELQPVIQQYGLQFELFDELIRGCETDLVQHRYATYEELEQYCYRVASVVGLLSIEVFGYTDPRCREYAIDLGRALQLTNILRDVRRDAARDRIYLPGEELRRHGVAEEEILQGVYSERYRRVAEAVAGRARKFYRGARAALPLKDRRSMVAAELMGSVYWRLFQKLEGARFNVFGTETARLSKLQKLALILRTWFRITSGAVAPNYGTPYGRRRLVVNADDFGRSRSINQAVVDAHRDGILTTASLMVAGDAFDEAVALAATPTLGVGLHLTLVCGRAVLPPDRIPGLTDPAGEFSAHAPWAGFRYWARPGLRDSLRAELAAQFERFHATGLTLDHVNGHLHLHLHPVVFDLLVEHAREWRIERLRLTRDSLALSLRTSQGHWLYRLSHAVIFGALSGRARPALARLGIRHTTAVFGLLQDGRVDEAYLLRLLPLLPPGDLELYSHPSLDRFRHEFDALVSPAVRAEVRRLGFELVRYQDL